MFGGEYDDWKVNGSDGEETEYNIHIPVLLCEVLSFLRDDIPDYKVADMTLGRAGHSSNILAKLPDCFLYGFDRDQQALNFSQRKLQAHFPGRFRLFHSNFSGAVDILKQNGVEGLDFALFDTGVSSPQFDDPARGFSYRYDAPLDMRMDQSQKLDAKTVVNTYTEEELSRIIYEYSGEKFARQIARSIVQRRAQAPIETTFQLVDAIKAALPAKILHKQGHPAKQTFMAIREEVNDERGEMERAVRDTVRFLNHGGRCCVITFNSDDDALIKKIFQEFCPRSQISRFLPPIPEKESEYTILTRKPVVPSGREENENPRSESAKMRVIERR